MLTLLRLLMLAAWLGAGSAWGYEPDVHQQLTFLAAKELNRCAEGSEVAPLTPLQVRYIANSNVGLANSNALVRLFRWSYFDPSAAAQPDRRFLWLVNTRFTDHYAELVGELQRANDEADRLRDLGRIVSYVQLVSSPVRAVPVYTARFWRGSLNDRFDLYPIDEQALEAALGGDCGYLERSPNSFVEVLEEVAADTLAAVAAPIGALPTTWEAFWVPGRTAGAFGDYGPAGNRFGVRTEFACAAPGPIRCVLLEGDPLYAEFALARRLAAVRGTARAMLLHQRLHAGEHRLPPRAGVRPPQLANEER